MKKVFKSISESLFKELKSDEDVILSFSGENSQFIRFNNASVRQTGLVDDADIELKFISNNRICGGGFTISGNMEIDLARGKHEIERMRNEANELWNSVICCLLINSIIIFLMLATDKVLSSNSRSLNAWSSRFINIIVGNISRYQWLVSVPIWYAENLKQVKDAM